jgi:membrane dipeptidase
MPADPAGAETALASWKGSHPEPRATLAQVADHIDHIRQVAGIDHVGLGSDFDGITRVPVGLVDVSRYPALLAELARRGYSDDDLRKVAGLNVIRALRQAEAVAARLQKDTRPSDARIEEVDSKK